MESVGIFSSDSPSLMRKRWTCSNGKGARVREVGRARVRLAGRARDTGRRRRLRTSPVLLPAATRCASWEMATHHVFTARRGNSDQRVGWRVQCAPWRRSAGRLVRSIAALSPAPPKPHPPSPRTCSGVNLLHQLALLQVPDLDLAVHRAGDGARPARVNVDRKHAQLVPLEAVLALEHLRLRVPARVERRKSGVEAGRVMGKRAGMGLGGQGDGEESGDGTRRPGDATALCGQTHQYHVRTVSSTAPVTRQSLRSFLAQATAHTPSSWAGQMDEASPGGGEGRGVRKGGVRRCGFGLRVAAVMRAGRVKGQRRSGRRGRGRSERRQR